MNCDHEVHGKIDNVVFESGPKEDSCRDKNMGKMNIFKQEEDCIKNKGRIERAVWFEKTLLYYDVAYSVIGINTREYPPEFLEDLPKWGSRFVLVDVRTWKKYDSYMNVKQFQISSLKELYKDKGNKMREGVIIGISNSPENINEVWIDLEYNKEDSLDMDKEKIIILSMIAARTFSKKSSVNLQDGAVRDIWKDVIDMSCEQLKGLDLIKLNKENLYDSSGIEDPIVNIFRLNSRSLQKKTKGLFRSNGDTIYFLDVSRGSEIIKDCIVDLMKMIVGKKIVNLDRIYKFCTNISVDKNIFIFDPYEHIFSRPEYDDVMKDIMLYCFY